MAGATNRGKYLILGWALRAVTRPTNLFVMLFTSAVAPDADTNVAGDLTEIAAGNGYTAGGYSLTPGATDFDVYSEDDTGDLGKIQIKDVVWSASGGPIPASGSGARYACLVDDNATVASRQVIFYWDLASDRTVSSGQDLTLADLEMRATET